MRVRNIDKDKELEMMLQKINKSSKEIESNALTAGQIATKKFGNVEGQKRYKAAHVAAILNSLKTIIDRDPIFALDIIMHVEARIIFKKENKCIIKQKDEFLDLLKYLESKRQY